MDPVSNDNSFPEITRPEEAQEDQAKKKNVPLAVKAALVLFAIIGVVISGYVGLTFITFVAAPIFNSGGGTLSRLLVALEEEYGEEFKATHMGDRIDTNHTKFFLHPKANEDIKFTATVKKDGSIEEDYVKGIITNKIERSLVDAYSKEGISVAVDAIITQELSETDKTLTVNEFFKKHSLGEIYIRIIFKDESIDPETIINVLRNSSNDYEFELWVRGSTIADEASFDYCSTYFYTYPTASETHIESSCSQNHVFTTKVSNGSSRLSVEELREILES